MALELARVFEREGARAGFAALERAPGCGRREESLTPRAVVTQVPIPLSGGQAYTVSVVEVATAAGAVEYLVTTRDVRP